LGNFPQLLPIGQGDAPEHAPYRKEPEQLGAVIGLVDLGDLTVEPFPPYDVIGGLGNECPVPSAPALVELEYFLNDLIGIFPFVEDQLKGIHYGKNKVTVQSHATK